MTGAHRADPSGEYGHIGWPYRDYTEFLGHAARYLAAGLNLGQRAVYVGDGDPATLRAGLAAAELLCLHPAAGPDSSVPFQLYNHPAQRNTIALTGSLDAAGEDLWAATLDRVLPLCSADTVNIDARELEFIGHRQLVLLDGHCAAHGRVAVLHSRQPLLHRLVDLFGFDNIRVGTQIR